MPEVRKMSLSAMGIPVSVSISPAAILLSAASALFRASSGVMVIKALTLPSTASIRSSIDLVASTEETSPVFSFECNSWMVSS